MRSTVQARVVVSAVCVLGGFTLLVSCATTGQPRPQQFRTFFLPPKPPAPDPGPPEPLAPPPVLDLYANELPSTTVSLPKLTHPNDPDLLLRQAEERFASGKKAIQEGRVADARRDFNRAIQFLLAAPDNLADRSRLERRLEEITDAIYRYDLDQMSQGIAETQSEFEKRPLDEILELTFPVDPSLRGKVKQEIRGTGSQLPLEESDAVLSYINYFTSPRGRRTMEYGLKRSGKYKAMIERVLEEEGLPKELIFLAQAESGFSPRAISIAKCVGLWQFATFRGKEYGLNQTSYTDDRMDPEKATHAAARHLKDLYTHFGDWYLAMAAYDCGPNCVDSAVARTGYADYWALRRMGVLPKETANYVPVILAMTIVGKNASDYGLNVDFDASVEYESVELKSPTHVALVAAALDIPVAELRDLNPALLRSMAPVGYVLRVPKGTVPQLEAAFDVVPESQRDSWRLHRVESGDTLASLARRYGALVTAVSAANHGELPEAGLWAAIPVAYPGDRVVKAPAKPAASAAKPAAPKPATAKPTATKPTATKPPTAKQGSRKPGPPLAHKTPGKASVKRSRA